MIVLSPEAEASARAAAEASAAPDAASQPAAAEQPFNLEEHIKKNAKNPNFRYAQPEKLNWFEKKLRKWLGEAKPKESKEPRKIEDFKSKLDLAGTYGTTLDQIRQGKYEAITRVEQQVQEVQLEGEQLNVQSQEVDDIRDEWVNEYKEDQFHDVEDSEPKAEEKSVIKTPERKPEMTPQEKVAEMIVRLGPDVKGGWGKVVEALKTGDFKKSDGSSDTELKEQAVAVINKVLEGAKWDTVNKELLEEVGDTLKFQAKEERYDDKQAKDQKERDEIIEYADVQQVLSDFGKFLERQKGDLPVKPSDPHMVTRFVKGEYSQKDVKEGLAMLNEIRKSVDFGIQSIKMLESFDKSLKKSLELGK